MVDHEGYQKLKTLPPQWLAKKRGVHLHGKKNGENPQSFKPSQRFSLMTVKDSLSGFKIQ